MTDMLTDVDVLVDEAFAEAECVCDLSECGGDDKVAYYTSHSSRPCVDGFLCQKHFQYFVDEYRPSVVRAVNWNGHVICGLCGTTCLTVDDYCKVMPL